MSIGSLGVGRVGLGLSLVARMISGLSVLRDTTVLHDTLRMTDNG